MVTATGTASLQNYTEVQRVPTSLPMRPFPIRALLLDLDDTLIGDRKAMAAAIVQLRAHMGLAPSQAKPTMQSPRAGMPLAGPCGRSVRRVRSALWNSAACVCARPLASR